MPLTDAQKEKAQGLLLSELDRRRETQPLLLINSILDGTAKQKLKMLLTQKSDQYQVAHDAADANTIIAKANLMAEIGALDAINAEII